MKRVDFLGVPGSGKTTVFGVLPDARHAASDFLLSTEAYAKAIAHMLPPGVRVLGRLRTMLSKSTMFQPLQVRLSKSVDRAVSIRRSRLETEGLVEEIVSIWSNNPELLTLRLAGLGKQTMVSQVITPTEYLDFFYKTALRMKQLRFMEAQLSPEARVVFDKSITQAVFSCVDFSQPVEAAIIDRYVGGIPAPAAVISFQASPDVIVQRIRQRAAEGWVSALHRGIVDTSTLSIWAERACEVAQHAAVSLTRRRINVIEVDAGPPPAQIASKICAALRSA